ncbi:Amino acid transporter AVT1B [Frankliniella fusca]|uniref:Amino acid transporter AVT1B n=1 Tax=Frankliniella fusca TaxID=407009 RepID=A0AAE1LQK0_9NEOP|nr:Amino acid transporter AVT1B [Frankliniella fusca]
MSGYYRTRVSGNGSAIGNGSSTRSTEKHPLLGPRVSALGPLRPSGPGTSAGGGLSLVFATLCIIDLFGVFPIVALPRPIIDCGWLGLPLAALVFALQVYTALLLGRCWVLAENIDPTIIDKSRLVRWVAAAYYLTSPDRLYTARYPYAALAHMTMGPTMSKMVTVLLDVTVFGAGVPNLLVASQNIQLFGLKMTDQRVDLSFCYWLIVLGILLCPIMWLGSPKDMKWLAVTSVCTVLSVAVLTWICMLQDDTLPATYNPIWTQPSWEALAIAYGIIAFQFDVHPMILTVQVDMQHKNKLGKAILGSFLVTGLLFMITTAIATWKYGAALRYNLLQGLPASTPLYVNVLLVTLQICLSMVVGGSALFQDIEDKLNIPREFSWRRCALRSSLVAVMVLLGEAVPRFDLVMGLIGGSLTGPLMFILPPLFYARLRRMSWRARLQRPPPWKSYGEVRLMCLQ